MIAQLPCPTCGTMVQVLTIGSSDDTRCGGCDAHVRWTPEYGLVIVTPAPPVEPTTWMAMQMESGNAIESFTSREAADEWWTRLQEEEPEALPVVGILSFDAQGVPIEVTHEVAS
jgi:hypothetical protein